MQPLDVVRTRMQEDAVAGHFRSMPATIRSIAHQSGVFGLWRGTQATVARLALGAGAHFLFLDLLRPQFEQRQPDGTFVLSPMGAAMTGSALYDNK
jgi:hypothetical protein